MDIQVGQTKIALVKGDITKQSVDVVVNAANSSLLGGGGVDGAIHRAGGPAILEACKAIRAEQGGCPVGDAVITTGGDLPAQRVIHTVGPVWQGGHKGEYTKLEHAYHNSLTLAVKEEQRTVAFPSISTGAYRFPVDRAALVALGTVVRFCTANTEALDEVRMVLFSEDDLTEYSRALEEVRSTMMG